MSDKQTRAGASVFLARPDDITMELTGMYEDCMKITAEQLASLFMGQEHPELTDTAVARLRKLAKYLVIPAMV